MKSVLIVEDHIELASQMKKYLEENGYEVLMAASYADALEKMNVHIALALLDIDLPDEKGHHLIKFLKERSIRIMITTVVSDENFIVDVLDKGADDYLIKPFSLAVLRARIDAVLRTVPLIDHKIISYGEIELDVTRSELKYKKNSVELTALEYELLLLFLKNLHRVYTRTQLLEMFEESVIGWTR